MKVYREEISSISPSGDPVTGTLTAIRLPQSWYAVAHFSDELYKAMEQKKTAKNQRVFDGSDEYFLGGVRLVFHWIGGVLYEYASDQP